MDKADWNLIKKLNDQFFLVNIHGNNHSHLTKINDKTFPQVIECTWVRKDLINEPVEYRERNSLNNQCNTKLPEFDHYLI
jgi:hypothetical protein